MACLHPILIRNRRYFDKSRPHRLDPHDDHLSALALRPYDVARQYILVPCGKCENCLRRLRNDWFVRLERELAYSRFLRTNSVFVTVTISPKYYDDCLVNPASFIRLFNERIRHRLGGSIKHAFFQEFGTHPTSGNEPRLHFHGFLFHVRHSYAEIRKAIGDLGFLWISAATTRRARYAVKYVTKQIAFNPELIKNKFITVDNVKKPLHVALLDSRYTRKFISAHVGDYIGNMPNPSCDSLFWHYSSPKTGRFYKYSVPRYYYKYMSSKDLEILAIRSAASYASVSSDNILRSIVSQCFKFHPQTTSLSVNRSFFLTSGLARRFASSSSSYLPRLVFSVPPDIRTFWLNNFNILLNHG